MQIPDTLQVRSSCLILYPDQQVLRKGKSLRNPLANFKGRATYSGEVSASAAKRISRTVSVFVQRSPTKIIYNDVLQKKVRFKFSFLTLTVPDLTTNNSSFYYQKLLKPFLRYLKSRFGVESYIWKAEIQSRGSIHYHLTLNTYVNYTYLRDKWNELLNANNLMESYKLKYGNTNPNSIDIHSVRSISNMEAYLIKYISKQNKDGYSFKGKVWGCSENLQNAKYFVEWLDTAAKENIDQIIAKGGLVLKYLDQCIVATFKKGYSLVDICRSINQQYINWCCGYQKLIPL